ncbi:hypothetical protein [Streptomyces sp. KL116D]
MTDQRPPHPKPVMPRRARQGIQSVELAMTVLLALEEGRGR